MSDFEVKGLKELEEKFKNLSMNFSQEKEKELRKIGQIAISQIKPIMNVDTGRMRNSTELQIEDENTAVISVNTDYAAYVNDGHLTRGGKSFVKGSHFMEKGLQNAESIIYSDIDKWMGEMLNKVGE